MAGGLELVVPVLGYRYRLDTGKDCTWMPPYESYVVLFLMHILELRTAWTLYQQHKAYVQGVV